MPKKQVCIKTAEDVCREYKNLSPLKKEKVKSYILGMIDARSSQENIQPSADKQSS